MIEVKTYIKKGVGNYLLYKGYNCLHEMKNKFKIQLWSVSKCCDSELANDKTIYYKHSEIETYYSDNLIDILYLLKNLSIRFKHINTYVAGTFDECDFSSWPWRNTTYYANVYLREFPLPFTEIPYQFEYPNYTACGCRYFKYRDYRYGNRKRTRKSFRSYKHALSDYKDSIAKDIEIAEGSYGEYDIADNILDKWQRKTKNRIYHTLCYM